MVKEASVSNGPLSELLVSSLFTMSSKGPPNETKFGPALANTPSFRLSKDKPTSILASGASMYRLQNSKAATTTASTASICSAVKPLVATFSFGTIVKPNIYLS